MAFAADHKVIVDRDPQRLGRRLDASDAALISRVISMSSRLVSELSFGFAPYCSMKLVNSY
ncbi:MAG: hypothetical protein FD144_1936 [Rhodospirillaceae bacterium]|nr:MAG: hypothetical protein FD144_1936 [Rhodospirillaceae bacterium]